MKVRLVTYSKLNIPYSYKLKLRYFCKNFSTLTEVAKFITQCGFNVYFASEQPEMSKRESQILVKKIQAYRRKHPIKS